MNHALVKHDVHRGYSAEVANAAALAAMTGFGGRPFSLDDIGRTVRQLDNEAIHRLVSVGPATWRQDNAGGGGGASSFGAITGNPTDNAALASALGALEPAIPTKLSAFNSDFGTAAGTVCQGNDSRLSDARTPLTHSSTHASGGGDALSPASIGAAASTHQHAWSGLDAAMKFRLGLELLPSPITSTTTASADVFRTTMALAAGDVARLLMATTSTYVSATNSRRVQVGYRTAADTFSSLGQYAMASALSAAVRPVTLQCVRVNGGGSSDYLFWGLDGLVALLAFTAPTNLVLQWNAWVDETGASSTINSIMAKLYSR